MSTTVELHRVKAELAALRADIRSLAAEWHRASGHGIETSFANCREELLLMLGDPA